MATAIVMPKLGWTMEEGVLAEWNKRDGDAVQAGEVLFIVESDKALNEVESFESGILRLPPDSPPVGATVRVGAVLGYIVAAGERAPFETNAVGETQPEAASGRLETAATKSQSLPSQAPGIAREFIPPEPSKVIRGSAGVNPAATGARATESNHSLQPRHKISPRARRAADELGVDLAGVAGSGRGGRIVERDVRAAQAAAAQAAGAARRLGRVMAGPRRLIAERMLAGAHSAAPVTLTTEADGTELTRLREQLRNDPTASALPLPSFTDLFVKLTAQALGEHPALNARLEGDTIVESAAMHIGVAVDTERGLLVPVVRDAQAKGLRQIAEETAALLERARAGRLSAEEMRDGTFTITNLGMYAIDAFTPILNLPECAILGLGRIAPRVVVVDEKSERTAIRQMMHLSLTFDHRVVDGAPAARFLQRIKQLVEQPYVWLVQ
jgi:pyruvate dehydrogenase E2 component (dihydrolipoamide acetyltransferase)